MESQLVTTSDTPAAVDERMSLRRCWTLEGEDVLDKITWRRTSAVIMGADGTEKFRQDDVEVPKGWSDQAAAIVAEKYFRVVDGVRETSVRQMIRRIVGALGAEGARHGVFVPEEREIFQDELTFLLVDQMFAFNSPVWFNLGVTAEPQCSACFINSVDDTMDSITTLASTEVMLFKGGSGTGTNLSPLRSSYERLGGGGYASGPVSFMRMFDAGAGVTKSGGTTRRAAKMSILDIGHPDILEQRDGEPGFIRCKSAAEQVAADLYSTGKYTAEFNVPGNVYDYVGFQNANNSVRVPDRFMVAVENDEDWTTRSVTDNKVIHRYKARDLWREIAEAAWRCGDPGVQFDTTTNERNTCASSGRINGSNPCSEFLFLDDTACNLGSLNLAKFAGSKFDAFGFISACRVAVTAMEILVSCSGYPTPQIAENSRRFRPLGLGYTNLAALLINLRKPYDSVEGRECAAAVTALMTGAAYTRSAELAKRLGPFEAYAENRDSMLSVIEAHYAHARGVDGGSDEVLRDVWCDIHDQWARARHLGPLYGFRHAQVTVLAPTGTISFLMDCAATGCEPLLSVRVYKKLVGGGFMQMANPLIADALWRYSAEMRTSILAHIQETGEIITAPDLTPSDRPVFATALGAGAIAPVAHLDMMAAIQPYLSGGISKTVNLPASATVEDFQDLFMQAWRLKLKSVAIYRDGCKLSQPISTSAGASNGEQGLLWGQRKRLPDQRTSVTHKMRVGAQEGYIHVGLNEDGSPAEIFLNIAKAGSTLSGLTDMAATAISLGLQHGVPLRTCVNKLKDMKFEPAGFTDHPVIHTASSVADYVGRWLEHTFLESKGAEETPKGAGAAKPALVLLGEMTGNTCTQCGNLTQRAGACWVCAACGTTTGCG